MDGMMVASRRDCVVTAEGPDERMGGIALVLKGEGCGGALDKDDSQVTGGIAQSL